MHESTFTMLPTTHKLLVASMGEYWLTDKPDEITLSGVRHSIAGAQHNHRASTDGASSDGSKSTGPTQVFVAIEHKLVYRWVH